MSSFILAAVLLEALHISSVSHKVSFDSLSSLSLTLLSRIPKIVLSRSIYSGVMVSNYQPSTIFRSSVYIDRNFLYLLGSVS